MQAYRLIGCKPKYYTLTTPLTQFIYKGYKLFETPAIYDYDTGKQSKGITVYLPYEGGFIDCERSEDFRSGAALLDFQMMVNGKTSFDEVLTMFAITNKLEMSKMPVKLTDFELFVLNAQV